MKLQQQDLVVQVFKMRSVNHRYIGRYLVLGGREYSLVNTMVTIGMTCFANLS